MVYVSLQVNIFHIICHLPAGDSSVVVTVLSYRGLSIQVVPHRSPDSTDQVPSPEHLQGPAGTRQMEVGHRGLGPQHCASNLLHKAHRLCGSAYTVYKNLEVSILFVLSVKEYSTVTHTNS